DALADGLAELDARSGVHAVVDARAARAERNRNQPELERVGGNENPAFFRANRHAYARFRKSFWAFDGAHVATLGAHHGKEALERRAVGERSLEALSRGRQ